IDGPGEIAAVGNGNPQSLEPYVADYRKLFFGKAMLILRSVEGKTGSIDVEATSEGMKSAKVSVSAK
ncbi:MAG TPA: hypothetical protein VEP89_04050, partial [Draconibacterium sp.]|nr:hypothetical protein [Draconibacterium sp.]